MPLRGIRSSSARVLVVTLALLIAHAPLSVLAQEDAEPSADQLELARSLYYDGLERVDAGKWAEAADLFERVLAIRDSAVVSYHLATAYHQLGRDVEARERLYRVLNDVEAAPELRRAAEQLLPDVEAKIGRLTVELRGDQRDIEVFINGQQAALVALDVPVPVDEGEVKVSVKREGEEVAFGSAEVVGGEGEPAVIELELPPAPESEPVAAVVAPRAITEVGGEPEPQDDPLDVEPGPRQRDDGGDGIFAQWWFWTAVGVVAAGTVAGVLVLTDEGEPADLSAVRGDFTPGLLEGTVEAP
ncbi:MAG: tetratricopeptide repeat protein [Myxococcales bacterium]|jgi:hypothetical protein